MQFFKKKVEVVEVDMVDREAVALHARQMLEDINGSLELMTDDKVEQVFKKVAHRAVLLEKHLEEACDLEDEDRLLKAQANIEITPKEP